MTKFLHDGYINKTLLDLNKGSFIFARLSTAFRCLLQTFIVSIHSDTTLRIICVSFTLNPTLPLFSHWIVGDPLPHLLFSVLSTLREFGPKKEKIRWVCSDNECPRTTIIMVFSLVSRTIYNPLTLQNVLIQV